MHNLLSLKTAGWSFESPQIINLYKPCYLSPLLNKVTTRSKKGKLADHIFNKIVAFIDGTLHVYSIIFKPLHVYSIIFKLFDTLHSVPERKFCMYTNSFICGSGLTTGMCQG